MGILWIKKETIPREDGTEERSKLFMWTPEREGRERISGVVTAVFCIVRHKNYGQLGVGTSPSIIGYRQNYWHGGEKLAPTWACSGVLTADGEEQSPVCGEKVRQ